MQKRRLLEQALPFLFPFSPLPPPLFAPALVQSGKTFCASFCASLIAGSRWAFLLSVSATSLCQSVFDYLFVCHWETEWNAQGVNVCFSKSFYTFVWFLFFVTWKLLWTRNNQCKGKTDHPVSLMSGIKSFEHFQRGEYFDCAFDLFVSCFAVFRRAELKPACILLFVNTFSHAQIYSLCRTSFIHLFSQRTICAP